MSAGVLTILTDFGLRDGYVAAMKGVILSRSPGVRLVDVTHEIPPGDVPAAAYVLRQVAEFFPAGTVHLVVVDPGVGSERRGIACQCGGQRFVAPDNGVLGGVLDRDPPARVHVLSRPGLWRPDLSPVFHGRDVFGPVAAHLAAGGELEEVGEPIDPATLVRASWPEPRRRGDCWCGEVIYVDHFGNLVTNLPLEAGVAVRGSVTIAESELRVAGTYSDVSPGALVGLRGSSGLLEIACRGGSAAEVLGAGRGLVVAYRARSGS